jgi:hypothetical protein
MFIFEKQWFLNDSNSGRVSKGILVFFKLFL